MSLNNLNISLSEITNFQKKDNQDIFIETAEAKVRLSVFTEEIIRITAVRKEQDFENFSYAVIAQPEKIVFTFSESENFYTLQTAQVRLEIQKKPLRFRFFSTDGTLLSEDDAGLGISWIGTEVTNYKTLQEGERFIGLGEKTGNLDRRERQFVNWSTDSFGYGLETDPLYFNMPFYMGLHHQKVYGIFLDNTYKTTFNFGASTDRFSFFKADDGELSYYFIHDASVAKIIEHFTYLTGRIKLPPLWSLGFQQCRYSYYPDTEVLNVAETFRTKDIPADVIYLDIHYMDKYKVFTWDSERFSKPADLIKHLTKIGFHVVLILDPGVKIEKGYHCYEEGLGKNVFLKYPDGELYQGEVWPGWCHFPDFTKPQTRDWWGENYKSLTEIGIEGFWNDMNEPAVWGNVFPDLVAFDYDGQRATHKKAHNVYGMQMVRATFENTKSQLNKRPFVLTRAGFAGSQRYAAVWTGDNVSADANMLGDVRLVNSLGLSGVSFAGYDVGGFAGEASVDLFNKWIAIGAFAPFFRCHTMINSRDAEPWAFGEESEEIARNYIKLRYRLLPYLYSAFYEATQTGLPVQRSLALDYSFDDKIYEETFQNEYLFGDNILVCPITSQHPIYKLYFPKGEWYDLFSDIRYTGGQEVLFEVTKDKIPLFVKASGILVMQSVISHTGEKPKDTLELHIYEGKDENSFVYYEDNGTTYDFEQGKFYRRKITFKPAERQVIFEEVEGSYTSHFAKAEIFWHGFEESEISPQVADKSLDISQKDYVITEAISNFDPSGAYESPKGASIADLTSSVVEWRSEAFVVGF